VTGTERERSQRRKTTSTGWFDAYIKWLVHARILEAKNLAMEKKRDQQPVGRM
jgi:hypothetical protein